MAEQYPNFINAQSVIDPADMVDLEPIDMRLPESQIIPKIMKNLNTVGFFALTNVAGYDEAELYRAVRAFYKDIPDKEHKKLIWNNFAPKN